MSIQVYKRSVDSMTLKPPVLIIGSHRSGTSMLVKLLGEAPEMVEWYEPRVLWKVGRQYLSHEEADESDAKSWVKRWIRRKFLDYQIANEDRRIVEKTPENALRIPFIRKVFPEAKLIYIERDGRAMLSSQLQEYRTSRPWVFIAPGQYKYFRTSSRLLPFWEWPAYIPRALSQNIRRTVFRQGAYWFGIRYKGWRSDRRRMSKAQLCAKQWVVTVERAERDLVDVPEDACLRLRYEDVVRNPRKWFGNISEFCDIPMPDEYLDRIENTISDASLNKWRTKLDPAALEEAMPILEPCLRNRGYFD